jgi:hypothetical protein
MTSYFDTKHDQLRKLGERAKKEEWTFELLEELRKLEDEILFDCQLVSMMPNFPEDLKDGMQLLIARLASEPLIYVHADDYDEEVTLQRLHRLTFDLHSLFHEVGRRGIFGFSDNPWSNMRGWVSELEERRIALMRKDPSFAEAVRKYDEGVARTTAELHKPYPEENP